MWGLAEATKICPRNKYLVLSLLSSPPHLVSLSFLATIKWVASLSHGLLLWYFASLCHRKSGLNHQQTAHPEAVSQNKTLPPFSCFCWSSAAVTGASTAHAYAAGMMLAPSFPPLCPHIHPGEGQTYPSEWGHWQTFSPWGLCEYPSWLEGVFLAGMKWSQEQDTMETGL